MEEAGSQSLQSQRDHLETFRVPFGDSDTHASSNPGILLRQETSHTDRRLASCDGRVRPDFTVSCFATQAIGPGSP